MQKTKRLLAILLAVLMTVSALPVNVFAVEGDKVITAVDTSELVMETKLLYDGTNAVTAPQFYDTLLVSTDGGETYDELSGVTWAAPAGYTGTCDGSESEEYTFTPVAPAGYAFADGVADIKVTVVAGKIGANVSTRRGVSTSHEGAIDLVVKGTKIYDATGCVSFGEQETSILAAGLSKYDSSKTSYSAFQAPEYDTFIKMSGETVAAGLIGGGYEVPLKGNTKIIVDGVKNVSGGVNVSVVYGGGAVKVGAANADVTENTDVTINDATLNHVIGGGWNFYKNGSANVGGNTNVKISNSTIELVVGGGRGQQVGTANVDGSTNLTIVDSTITTLCGGGNSNGTADYLANVSGDVNVDISGKTVVGRLIAGGNNAQATVAGTVYLTIHDLKEGSSIGTIEKRNASKLVVNLDETSKHLFSKITIDNTTTVNIEGETYKDLVGEGTVTGLPKYILKDAGTGDLPTTFGSISGFSWSGDTSNVGEQTFTLTAPTGYFFDGLVKTKEYTITVVDEIVKASGVTLDKTEVTLREGQTATLTATVEPENVLDDTVTWSSNKEDVATVENGVVKAVGVGEATITVKTTDGGFTAECAVNVKEEIVITNVADGVVLETKLLYDGTNAVAAPQFYDTLSVSTDDGVTYDELSGITWTTPAGYTGKCDGSESEEYTFTPVAPAGYVFAAGVADIKVTVVAGKLGANVSSRRGVSTSHKGAINLVVKGTKIYDATGCVSFGEQGETILAAGLSKYDSSKTSYSEFQAPEYDTSIKMSGETVAAGLIGGGYEVPLKGNTKIIVDGVKTVTGGDNVSVVYGGGAVRASAANADVTGNTDITVNDATLNHVIGGGWNFYKNGSANVGGNTTVEISNSTVNLVVGGGRGQQVGGANVAGNTTVIITDSTVTTLCGGGNSNGIANYLANVSGDVNIDISGKTVIDTLVAGGNNEQATVAGTAYVTIHDLEEGASIGTIERRTASRMVVRITSSDAVDAKSLLEKVENWQTDPLTEVYIDGMLMQKVSKVEAPATVVYNVALGTQTAAMPLPTTLDATANGGAATVKVEKWGCDSYDASVAGTYTFTPVFSEGCDVSEADVSEAYVIVRVLTGNPIQTITAFDTTNPISVSLGTAKEQIPLPVKVNATVGGQSVSVEVDHWTCDRAYDGSVFGATYTFTATVSGEYTHEGVAAPTVVVEVTSGKIVEIYLPVTETTFPRNTVNSPAFYDTLTVKLDNGVVTEVSGFEWSVENYKKDTVGTYTASIKGAPANYEFASSLNKPTIKINVVRQNYEVLTLDTNIYLYGIPTVVNEDNGGTYLYDLTGCNKTSATNISGKTIFAGGPANSTSLKTTYIEVRGGTLTSVYGGSRANTKITDTAYVYMLGGKAANVFGGGHGGTALATRAVTQNAYVYVENATVTTRVTGSGNCGNIAEDATVIVRNSTVKTVYGGSYAKYFNMGVDGTATIKLLDGAKLTQFYGAGRYSTINDLELYISKNATISKHALPAGFSNVEGTAKVYYETGFDISGVYTEEENVELYEGRFLEDRETFVTEREITVVRKAGLVRGEYYVDYGTSLENIGLPTSFEGEIDGVLTTVEGITYTPVTTYNGNISGRYEFKLGIPDGYNVTPTTLINAGTVTVVVAEANQSGTITAFEANDPHYTFEYGTAIENIGLPSAYEATVSGGKKTVPVKKWNVTTEYDRYTAGTYVFTPEFADGYTVNAQLPTYTVKLSQFEPYRYRYIRYLNGIPAVVDVDAKGVTLITDKNGNYLEQAGDQIVVFGGSDAVTVDSTDITVNGGSLRGLYGGSNLQGVEGDTRIVINDGTVTTVYAAGNRGTVDASELIINDGTITTVHANIGGSIRDGVYYEVNGGTITRFMMGANRGDAGIEGWYQEEDEKLADSSEKSDEPIVVKKGELISAVFVQNGGTIKSLYGGGNAKGSRTNGSVKIYLNGGTTATVCGGGYLETALIMGNVYIKVSKTVAANLETIIANAPGAIYGKAYVILPEGNSFNRYDVVGWNENDDGINDDSNTGEGGEEEGAGETTYVSAEVIVSGGYYEETIPVRIVYMGAAQTVYAYGIPVRVVGESVSSGDDETSSETSTYIHYFKVDENGTEIFEYPTYVDAEGNQIQLKGNWEKIPTPLESGSSPVIYGGGMQGTTDKYPSTYVEFRGGYLNGIYGGGRNNTAGAANIVLNSTDGVVNYVYGGGNVANTVTTNKVYVKVENGSYNRIVAGGNVITTKTTQVDVTGGSVGSIFMGTYAANITGGTVTLNLANCTVGNIYGGGYNASSKVVGAAYINVNDNVNITGYMYPMGAGKIDSETTSGKVLTKAYVTLGDTDALTSQFKKIKYTNSQAPYIYVNGVVLGEKANNTIASFETAEKKVEVVRNDRGTDVAGRLAVYLNGIPTVVAGDGAGHAYIYQAKTKDGTLDIYQKDENGNFKFDENGKRISNIVRDPDTGMAIKGPRLTNYDVADYILYGGAIGKSVEDTYIEFHNGGEVFDLYAGCRGGNAGYDAQGNEVGLVEVRMFDGGAWHYIMMGNVLGHDISGKQSINTMCAKSVLLCFAGRTTRLSLAGSAGTNGSEEKFIEGYYNKAGEVISYTDEDDGRVYEITGEWKEYNLDVTKDDYNAYAESYIDYCNGDKDNKEFLNSRYYVDPYDDHYTTYCLLGRVSTTNFYAGTYTSQYDLALNRVFGNRYIRRSAYGFKYDAELDMFVDNYEDFIGLEAYQERPMDGSVSGVMYNDIRSDWEGAKSLGIVYPLGYETNGAQNLGHTYLNLYETDDNPYCKDEIYKNLYTKSAPNLTVNRDIYPRWSMPAAWALGLDECMPQLAIDMGYITETNNAEDVRISMLSADDATELLNYYYTGSTDVYVNAKNAPETEGYQDVLKATENDIGKFTTRMLSVRYSNHDGKERYLNPNTNNFGDAQIITFPNGETMLIDSGGLEADTVVNNIKYYLESLRDISVGDGKTIDYIVITHFHADHDNNMAAVMKAFDFKNVIITVLDDPTARAWYAVYEAKSEQYAAEGKDPIEFMRVSRGDVLTIGEGDEAVKVNILNPGDQTYKSYTLDKLINLFENEKQDGTAENEASLAVKFEYKGQSYFTAGDIQEYAEVSMLRTYDADYLKSDVMKLSHHGYSTSNTWAFLNAINPDVVLSTQFGTMKNALQSHQYLRGNNTGGYAESVFVGGIAGHVKVTLDGEKVTTVTQFKNRAFERDDANYIALDANYSALVEEVAEKRNSLTVVADNSSAPYGTAYIWNSFANYFDGEFEELSKRYYSGTMTSDMLTSYKDKLEALAEFIDDATMYGGTDTTPDVELPGTGSDNVGGDNTTAGGTAGGIIGDIGGGNAGEGIGGGAAAGGAVGGDTGDTGDTGETTDPVTPTPDVSDRRFIDVAETDWFNNAVNYVADNNYFQGVSEKEFAPSGKMTRAMLVTVIGRMANADTNAENIFADVEAGSWYAGYVAWAAANGIVTGLGDNKFAPNNNVTREQIAAILMRYTAHKGLTTEVSSTEKYDSMKDTAEVSEYAVEAMKWATAYGIINGADGNINPKGNATRAEVAQMIMNFCNTFAI